MPIGAILGIGSAVASIGGAIIGGNSTKKAAKQAADTSLAVADKNNALAREFHTAARSALQPFTDRGNVAGNAYMELLGLGPQPAPSAFAGYGQAPMGPSPMAFNGYYPGDYVSTGGRQMLPRGSVTTDMDRMSPLSFGAELRQPWSSEPTMGPMSAIPGAVSTQAPTARSAFDAYRGSTGYDFRFNEGMRTLNTGAASGGGLYSGAAEKAKIQYGQNIASDEFGRYMSYLSGPMSMGLSSASALAGVGQGTVGMITANNTQAGSDAANAALMRGAANANMWQGIAGGLGSALGSSYGWWGK